MIRSIKTSATAPHPARTQEVNGFTIPQIVQRRWAGEASDQTIRNWLREAGLERASISVDGIEKARRVHLSRRTVEA
jgi:hypothetical protein